MSGNVDWEIDLERLGAQETYHLLTALIVPRPIGWVSTVSRAGTKNLAPFGYYNMCSHAPPVLHITDSGSHTDTLRNIRETGEFVCNVVSYDLVEAMNYTAIPFPPDVDEFEWAGLTSTPSVRVLAPRVTEARAAIECRLRQFVPIGNDTMILGDILHVHVRHEVVRGGRVDPELLKPICRFSGNRYAEFTRMYRLPRPSWQEIETAETAGHLPRYSSDAWRGIDSADVQYKEK
jgi:flavin reductase (DIM6/NTAB) family NADH-FMN oxidoreductase RutF